MRLLRTPEDRFVRLADFDFELDVPLDDLKAAAKVVDGRINDAAVSHD